ncbi:hypothetical protein BCU93_02545 [Vibrio breoganii]|uniref:tripartite tricarboxylate transporter TctB family protein n=1 Tax=Vibrio breoganii TaxID=553239 RepID=UPI000C82C7D9|nr:tripartite tricarboxylate transporter TctB family protein [Vibrio breoganii]PMG35214.1 hypothetical protein BCU93_02545 [Vibrio breoganii]
MNNKHNPNTVDTDVLTDEQLEQQKMHGWDFAFSIVVMIFATCVIATSATMPFSGTVGGISTVWYESPGLLPMIIGCAMFLAGVSVFLKTTKENGKALFLKHVGQINPSGFLMAAGGILSYIFVLISWYDFFLASAVFLLFYIGLYYLDEANINKSLLKIYYSMIVLSIAIFMSGANEVINSGYPYVTDLILLATGLLLIIKMFKLGQAINIETKLKVRRMVIIALVFPAVLSPIFRYFLLVPLPNEGLVVEQVFNTTYYNYLAPAREIVALDLSDEALAELDDAF